MVFIFQVYSHTPSMRSSLFWDFTQRIVLIYLRRFGITNRSHTQGGYDCAKTSITKHNLHYVKPQNSSDLLWNVTEAWNHPKIGVQLSATPPPSQFAIVPTHVILIHFITTAQLHSTNVRHCVNFLNKSRYPLAFLNFRFMLTVYQSEDPQLAADPLASIADDVR